MTRKIASHNKSTNRYRHLVRVPQGQSRLMCLPYPKFDLCRGGLTAPALAKRRGRKFATGRNDVVQILSPLSFLGYALMRRSMSVMEPIANLYIDLPWVIPVKAAKSLTVIEFHAAIRHVESIH